MASRRYPKRAVPGGVDNRSRREKRIKAQEGTTEQEVFILFDTDVDYVVEKLNVADLPPTVDADGKPVTWFVNFSIKDTQGNPVNGVMYSMLFPPLPKDWKLVIYDGTTAAYFAGTINDRAHNGRQWKEARLDIGDPGGGGTPGA